MNWKGNGSNQPGVICGTIARIACRKLEKPWKLPERIVVAGRYKYRTHTIYMSEALLFKLTSKFYFNKKIWICTLIFSFKIRNFGICFLLPIQLFRLRYLSTIAPIYKPTCTLKKVRKICEDWIHMVQGAQNWRAFVNAAKNQRVPYNPRNFLIF
jgi:hypothetical protein